MNFFMGYTDYRSLGEKKILSDYLTQDDINRLSNHLHLNAQIEIFPDAISGERW